MWDVLGRILWSKHRDLFAAQLGSSLLLVHLGIVPGSLPGQMLGFFFKGFLGFLIDEGVFVIDLSLDALREGQKLEAFKKDAAALYEKATAKVYDESEKQKIRKQYLDLITRIGVVGDGPK